MILTRSGQIFIRWKSTMRDPIKEKLQIEALKALEGILKKKRVTFAENLITL